MGLSGDVSRGQPTEHDEGHSVGADDLAVELGAMAHLQHQTPEDMMSAIVRFAVDIIPGIEHRSISIVTGRKLVTSQVPMSDLPRQVDEIQVEEGGRPLP